MIVGLGIMLWMVMVVYTMVSLVIMVVGLRVFPMGMFVGVFMGMAVAVGVPVFMGVQLVVMAMFMSMFVVMFVLALHDKYLPFWYSMLQIAAVRQNLRPLVGELHL